MTKKFTFILLFIEPEHLILVQTQPEWVKRSTHAVEQPGGGYIHEETAIALFAIHYRDINDEGTEGSVFWRPHQEIDRWEEEIEIPQPQSTYADSQSH